ncbi:MAG: pitrilysin family protein [Bacteroidota bacterium]
MDIQIFELSNGLRVVYKFVPYTRTVHCGYVINAGSRDDLNGEMGMAHFIEHMIFKGTAKRKTYHILNYLESVGGEVNAYTTKEKTCLYASMVAEHFERATELLTDITFNSVFPEKEIVKEKQVISEEIDMYRNSPDEAIFEDFDDLIFPQHGLGHPILGTKDSIRDFTKERVQAHLGRAFIQDQVVFSIVGNVPLRKVQRIIDKYLAPLEVPSGERILEQPGRLIQMPTQEVAIDQDQAHEIMGGRAYAMRQGNYVPFLILNNLLGGPAMNTRLNLNIREKHGLSYNIYSFYIPYQDSGIWGIYYACERQNLRRIRRLVQKELKSLRDNPLGVMRLSQAKKQLIGQLTLSSESLLSQMLGMAKDMLDFGQITPFSTYIEEIEAVSAHDIMDTAHELFPEEHISRLTYTAS